MFLIYQVVCCHKNGDFEEYPHAYYKPLNLTLLKQKYQGLYAIYFTVWKLMAPTKQ